MKTSTAIASTLLGTVALAAPSRRPLITVSLINEFAGTSGEATVPANGQFHDVPSLFGNSAIDENGQILASSANLTRFVDNVFCSFNKGDRIIAINSQTPSVDLDGNANVALLEPILMNEFQLQCQV
ncbi:hypothetical protein BS50DRAFT_261378 [Corynespora cassiicola Philippines]|uniref:Uncharacterized protein n=1 Tax=Corynespora cassiicola Philippines TaxID=1448308 RepID=A0A2T2N1A5_CORCC|nr:hypothetical protein BS50DRAFT_261378 [Corynespora cassiicola Philippines]